MKTNLWKSLEFLIHGFSRTYFQVCVGIIVTSLVIYTQGYYYQYKCEKRDLISFQTYHILKNVHKLCIGSLQGKRHWDTPRNKNKTKVWYLSSLSLRSCGVHSKNTFNITTMLVSPCIPNLVCRIFNILMDVIERAKPLCQRVTLLL